MGVYALTDILLVLGGFCIARIYWDHNFYMFMLDEESKQKWCGCGCPSV